MLLGSYANAVQGVGSNKGSSSGAHIVCDNDEDSSGSETRINPQYNLDVVDNNSHPLYIHNNDHPCIVLIAKKLVGPDNYAP